VFRRRGLSAAKGITPGGRGRECGPRKGGIGKDVEEKAGEKRILTQQNAILNEITAGGCFSGVKRDRRKWGTQNRRKTGRKGGLGYAVGSSFVTENLL